MKAVWTIDNNLPALQEEIPSWVPPSVVTIALGGHLRWEPRRFNCRGEEQPIDPIGRRLLIDPRMERVWGELKKHIPNEPYITKVNQECYASDLNNYDSYCFRSSLSDKAYAAYFGKLIAIIYLTDKRSYAIIAA